MASQCLRRGLVDEVLVYVLPVLLGNGVRFSTPDIGRIDLEPLSNTQSGPVTMLRFRVRKWLCAQCTPSPSVCVAVLVGRGSCADESVHQGIEAAGGVFRG